MAKNLNAAAVMTSWKAGFTASGQAYKEGVQGVTESPMAKAATPQAMADYVDGVQRSVADGTRAAGLAKGNLQSWQQACTTTGAQRLTSGAEKGAQKYQAWLASGGLAAMQAAKDAAAAITGPKGDIETGLQKVRAAVMAMKASKRR